MRAKWPVACSVNFRRKSVEAFVYSMILWLRKGRNSGCNLEENKRHASTYCLIVIITTEITITRRALRNKLLATQDV